MLRTTLISLAALGLAASAVHAQPPGPPAGGPPGAGAAGARPPQPPGPRLPRPWTPDQYVDRAKARGPAYDLAIEAAVEAINHCKADNQKISVQVTDSANELVVLVSPNESGMRSLRLMHGKSISVYMTGKASSNARAASATNPALAARIADDVAVSYPGSVPIYVGDDMIGAITVSGSSNNTDEVCANAGLSKIQARLK